MMGMTVVTYGGGEILKNIFESVAMLLNSQSGSLLKPLTIITISLGTLWALLAAFMANSGQVFLSKFVMPLIAITGLLMIPSGSVHVEDILRDRSYKVDHVPLLMAKFAEVVSSIGYKITVAVEQVMHVPNDVSYNSTGMIFGADTALDISRYQISNAELDQNLRRFCKQCVLFDLGLGKYSLDEVKKSTDLWKFFEENTSKVRMMTYTSIGDKKGQKRAEYISCKNAIKKMTPYFNQEKQYLGQLDVIKNLPLTFQALTGIQKEKEELISQQLMMHLVKDEFAGKNFASSRAAAQQRSTYQVLGALASSSLVTLRSVLEALVYASFVFILPLSVLPGGVKYLMTWAGLVVWIQMWPPFYAILNYIMQTVAHGYSESVFHGLTGARQGLSLFTSVGIHNIQMDIYALSGYLAASIPFITYAILKGGVSSFIHLAGSMMTPAHSAATTAASEQVTGNYSFGNANFGQTSYQNTSAFQHNTAPTLSSGFFQENKGGYSITHTPNEQIIRQSNSDLRTSVMSDDSITQSMQKAKMHAESTAETSQRGYSESINSNARHFGDFVDHLSKSESYTQGVSEREAADIQESARYFQNIGENWGKQEGLSARKSMENLVGLGINFGVAAKSHVSSGANKDQMLSAANNIVKSEEFQKNFQRLKDFSQTKAANSLDDEGVRLSEGYAHSLEIMQSSQESYQNANTQLNQVSENATWAEQNSHLIRRSLNQDFINWATEKYADQGGFSKVESILLKGNIGQQEELVQSFVSHIRSNSAQLQEPSGYIDPAQAAHHDLHQSFDSQSTENALHQFLNEKKEMFSTNPQEKSGDLQGQFLKAKHINNKNFESVLRKIENSRKEAIDNHHNQSDRYLVARSLFGDNTFKEELAKTHPLIAKIINPTSKEEDPQLMANGFQLKEAPFWMAKK